MLIYIVKTNYLDDGLFGTYRSLVGARKAIVKFITENENLNPCGENDYTYFATDGYQGFYFEIICSVLED